MKRYDVKVLNRNNKDIYMIFSTSYLSPLKFIPEIEKELSMLSGNKIEVIFDLFLSNGNMSERYGKAYFDGKNFMGNSFEFIEVKKNSCIRNLSAEYYKNEINNVDFSFLNNIQKKMIIKGIAI